MEQDARLEDGRIIKHSEVEKDNVRYFPGGRIMTLEEVKNEGINDSILIYDIKYKSKDKKIIKTRLGTFQYYDREKTIVI